MIHYLNHIILAIAAITIAIICAINYHESATKKKFILTEMRKCLVLVSNEYPSETIKQCNAILDNIEKYCSMNESYQHVYTCGSHSIGANWYSTLGRFELTLPNQYETIAIVNYPK